VLVIIAIVVVLAILVAYRLYKKRQMPGKATNAARAFFKKREGFQVTFPLSGGFNFLRSILFNQRA